MHVHLHVPCYMHVLRTCYALAMENVCAMHVPCMCSCKDQAICTCSARAMHLQCNMHALCTCCACAPARAMQYARAPHVLCAYNAICTRCARAMLIHACYLISMHHSMRGGSQPHVLKTADFGRSRKARLEAPGSCRDACLSCIHHSS